MAISVLENNWFFDILGKYFLHFNTFDSKFSVWLLKTCWTSIILSILFVSFDEVQVSSFEKANTLLLDCDIYQTFFKCSIEPQKILTFYIFGASFVKQTKLSKICIFYQK